MKVYLAHQNTFEGFKFPRSQLALYILKDLYVLAASRKSI